MTGITIVGAGSISTAMDNQIRGMSADLVIMDDMAFYPDETNMMVKLKSTYKFKEREMIWIACGICRKRKSNRTIRGQNVCNICRPINVRR